MKVLSRWLWIPAIGLALVAGCKGTCCKKSTGVPPPPGSVVPGPIIGPPVGTTPTTPGSSEILMPSPPPGRSAPPPPAADAFRAPLAPSTSAYPGPAAPNLSQSAYLAPPAQSAPAHATEAPQPTIRLLAPESTEPAPSSGPRVSASPKVGGTPTPAFTSGIPGFAPALGDKVVNGRKPMLDGLDWLKANGYRGALMLRRPQEPDAADRKQFEQRGLKFTSLEVNPETLSRSSVEEFARWISDPTMQPLFIYDTNGSLTGPLWFRYFRDVEKLSDDAARIRAGRLGLQVSTDADRTRSAQSP